MVTSRMTTWLRVRYCQAEVIDLCGDTSESEPEGAPPSPKKTNKQAAPAEHAPKKQPRLADGPRVLEGQCEGITKAGTRCCVHRDSWSGCARPLKVGARFCTHHDPAKFTGVQCAAIKSDGCRCRVFSGSAYVHAQPLREGSLFCHHHRASMTAP